jgi:hypothetical protein
MGGTISIGGNPLNENIKLKFRDELEAKMAAVFGDQIKELSTEMKEILINDMVTAFESGINVNRPHPSAGIHQRALHFSAKTLRKTAITPGKSSVSMFIMNAQKFMRCSAMFKAGNK